MNKFLRNLREIQPIKICEKLRNMKKLEKQFKNLRKILTFIIKYLP